MVCSDFQARFSKQTSRWEGPKCYKCGEHGLIKRNCVAKGKNMNFEKHKVNKANVWPHDCLDDKPIGLMLSQVLTANVTGGKNKWIIDCGATCLMCYDQDLFIELEDLEKPQEVILGVGCSVEAKKYGVVMIDVQVSDVVTKKCNVHNVLYVPKFSFYLLSVPKATKYGLTFKFSEEICKDINENLKLLLLYKVRKIVLSEH
jgi:hypothetical protein